MFIDDLKSFNKEKAQLVKPENVTVSSKVKEEPADCDLKPLFDIKTEALNATRAFDLKIKEEMKCIQPVSSVKNSKRQSSSMMQSPAPKTRSNKKKKK